MTVLAEAVFADRKARTRAQRSCISLTALGLLCCALTAACVQSTPAPAGANTSAPKPDAPMENGLAQAALAESKLRPGDVIAPLPPGSPAPPADPRNFEGTWAGIGSPVTTDGLPVPYLPKVQAQLERRKEKEMRGEPVVDKGSLCRPPGAVTVTGNQFPTLILQRPDKMLFIAEENRGVWPIYMNAHHPQNLEPSYTGHNVGRWEGNTLVIDSVGFNGKPNSAWGAMGPPMSAKLHIITRITRARTGDDAVNSARLVIARTFDDPQVFRHPYTVVSVARWRPDLEMLEFNCEESPQDLTSDGLVVQ